MKAIFMTEIGGKLMEIERREIQETDRYYVAVMPPMSMQALSLDATGPIDAKKQVWLAASMPYGQSGLAVFLYSHDE